MCSASAPAHIKAEFCFFPAAYLSKLFLSIVQSFWHWLKRNFIPDAAPKKKVK
jgi:hypothetical protein